jgi:ABC-type transporter Mla MlaB component
MTLRIERIPDGKYIALRLSGRLRSEHLAELKSLIADSSLAVVLDLDEITQVDVDAVNFLRKCQAEGIELRHCPPYICEWMYREQNREARRSY